MRSTLIALLCLSSSAAFAGENLRPEEQDLVEHCKKDGGREFCLKALTALRCHQLAFPWVTLGMACAREATRLSQAFDFKTQPVALEEPDGSKSEHELTVIFTTRLREMIREPSSQTFIRELMTALRRAGRDATPFNLWEKAIELSGGDEFKALERLAVLLQDTSRTRVQIFFLRELESKKLLEPAALEAVGNLQVLQEIIRDDRFREMGMPSWLTLYPRVRNLNRDLNASPYHFYPMAYVATRLERDGLPKSLAYFFPFLFNTEYEFQELDPEAWPLRFPQPFPIDSSVRWKLQDIYGGLAGGLFGVGRVNALPDYKSFTRKLGEDPKKAMREMFFLID